VKKPTALSIALSVTVVSLALGACGSSSSGGKSTAAASGQSAAGSASSSDAGSVAVDVGTGTPVSLKKGPLKVGIFLSGAATKWGQVLGDAAVAKGKELGFNPVIVSSDFDLQKRLSQAQVAATNKTYDAILVEPVASAQECDVFTKTLPKAGVLVIDIVTPLCGKGTETGDAMWSPGTATYVGGDTTIGYVRSFLKAVVTKYPGKQTVAFVTGPEIDPLAVMDKQAVQEIEKDHPDFKVKSFVNSDWTTPSAQKLTQAYLAANPDVTLILSAYSPDVSRGVVGALTALGKAGKIPVADQGGTEYSVQQIKSGSIGLTIPYFPANHGTLAMQAIADAQSGKQLPKWISDVPTEYGSVDAPLAVTSQNLGQFKLTPGW
jgi:ABC-type sugar transport system substrate-binding protein